MDVLRSPRAAVALSALLILPFVITAVGDAFANVPDPVPVPQSQAEAVAPAAPPAAAQTSVVPAEPDAAAQVIPTGQTAKYDELLGSYLSTIAVKGTSPGQAEGTAYALDEAAANETNTSCRNAVVGAATAIRDVAQATSVQAHRDRVDQARAGILLLC